MNKKCVCREGDFRGAKRERRESYRIDDKRKKIDDKHEKIDDKQMEIDDKSNKIDDKTNRFVTIPNDS